MAFDNHGLPLPGILGSEWGTTDHLVVDLIDLPFAIAAGGLFGVVIVIIEIIIDVILLLVDAFSGVPTMEKSLTISQRLLAGHNPAAFLWGNNILRAVQGLGIPLSTSDPHERKIIDAFTHQFVFNMVQQGLTRDAAKKMAGEILSNTTGPKQQLPAILAGKLDVSFKIWGDKVVTDTYNAKYQQLISKGDPTTKAAKLALRHVLQTVKLKDLVNIIISKDKPIIGPPIPPPPPPPPPGGGNVLDPDTAKAIRKMADCICTIEQTLGKAAADDCLCRIAKAIEDFNTTSGDDAFLKQLAKDGFISASDLQLILS